MESNLYTAVSLIPLLFLLVGLTVTVSIDPYISRNHRRVMLLIIALSVVLIMQNMLDEWIADGPPRWFLRTTTAVIGYSLRPVFLILFLYIVQPGKKYLGCWALAFVNFLLQTTAYYSHLVFWISSDNHWTDGPLVNTCLIVSLILMAYWLYQSFRACRDARRQDRLIPMLVFLMILTATFMDIIGGLELPVSLLTSAIVIGSVFYYIWLHLRFVREHEDDLKARQRMQIMLSQIQPHFLYNTLSAIQYLCAHDPKAAGETTEKFSRYLQGNMSALRSDGEIPFERELEHTKIYLEIEQIRFEDALQVEYDIACTEFSLPTLTLQPIAENAVRHGVRGRKGVGTVRIATREYPNRWEITVADDGPGFDLEAPVLTDDGREHIGISNVRDRLERISGGTLQIRSAPGSGAVVTIAIPKKEKAK